METKEYKINLKIKNSNLKNSGLFNYDDETVKTIEDNLNDNYYIFRKYSQYNNLIIKKPQNINFDPKTSDLLFRVRKSINKSDSFEIIKPIRTNLPKNKKNINNLDNNIWYVLKTEKTEGNFHQNEDEDEKEDYILNENDIIKLGDKKFEVIKKCVKMDNKNKIEKESNLDDSKYNISEMNKEKGSIFNINLHFYESYLVNKVECFKCEYSYCHEDNKLFKICSCKYIHYECFKEYLKDKLKKKSTINNIIAYELEDFYCDKCFGLYPLKLKLKNVLYNFNDLIDLNVSEYSDYIILESLDTEISKTIYVIPLKETIQIGRISEHSKIINDIGIESKNKYISKNHAILKYNNNTGELIIRNQSKYYGTLVLIKGNIKIKKKEINLQVGRSYIIAQLKESE